MKRKTITHAARLLCVLALAMTMTTAAFAADPPEPAQPSPCYPTAVTRSEDGGEIRKMYDLGPEDDPAGIPRSDFEQEGYAVTSVNKISDTDNSLLAPTAENCITLFTCVRNQRAYRWAVRAVEV